MTELDLLDRAAAGMAVQRDLLDLSARNVAAAQASTPGHPFARLVADMTTGSGADGDGDADADDGIGGDAGLPQIAGVHRERGSGDPLTELIAVLDAQRAYESDASVFDTGKRIVERTLDLERS
jgi:flagellar basal body rod protein FlgC